MPRTLKTRRPPAPRVPDAFIPGAASCRLPGAIEFTGLGRTCLLAHVKAGRLHARKAGRALVFQLPDLVAFIGALPPAGPPARGAGL